MVARCAVINVHADLDTVNMIHRPWSPVYYTGEGGPILRAQAAAPAKR